MTISNRLSPVDAVARPSLEAFQQAAREGDWVHVSQDGTQWKVLATGTTPSQRSVAWIEPESDATSAFAAALEQSFSRGIQSSVVRELGLGPAPGKALSSRTVMQAIDMAQTSQNTLRGVDFLTQLAFSATSKAPGFLEACRSLGVSADALPDHQLDAVDAAMHKRFELAAGSGAPPVAMREARDWLQQELTALLQGGTAAR